MNFIRQNVNLVFDLNRIIIGSLILIFCVISFLFKFDYLFLVIISALSIYDLYKSNFIKKYFDFIFFILFVLSSYFIIISDYYINYLNIILIFLTFFTLIKPNIYQKRLFLIIILLFLNNFYSIFLYNRNLLYFIVFISFYNDSFAYLFGKIIKGPLIIPSISPKKTWSGTIFSSLITCITLYLLDYPLLISIILSVSLFLGDIFFSYIKRINNLKDFSNILKGHGGVLDRLDSMFFFIIIINYYL